MKSFEARMSFHQSYTKDPLYFIRNTQITNIFKKQKINFFSFDHDMKVTPNILALVFRLSWSFDPVEVKIEKKLSFTHLTLMQWQSDNSQTHHNLHFVFEFFWYTRGDGGGGGGGG